MGAEVKTLATPLKNEKGIALLETIPLLVIFVMLISFGLGLFGAVHTAILHSIGARTYAFESFRQRTNLSYFRENGSGNILSTARNFSQQGWRYHAVQNEKDDRSFLVPSTRSIALGRQTASIDSSVETNNTSIYALETRNTRVEVNPIWVMVGYGICLNMACGN